MKKILVLVVLLVFINTGCRFSVGTENHDIDFSLGIKIPNSK